MDAKRAVVIGVFLGLTAALVVWWLERFETERLIGEVDEYLAKHDAFTRFLKDKEAGGGGPDAGAD